MSNETRTPRGSAWQGRAAGSEEGPSRRFPPGEYHGTGRRSKRPRPEFVRVLTPQGRWVVAGAFVERDGELVFVKRADADKHLLRFPSEAWAVATSALEEVARRNVQRVFIEDPKRGAWWCWLADFEAHGVPLDRGFGPQVALALNWWSFAPAGSETARQLGLFGEG